MIAALKIIKTILHHPTSNSLFNGAIIKSRCMCSKKIWKACFPEI